MQSDIICLLSKNGYPPKTFGDIYAQIIEQVENFKKNNTYRGSVMYYTFETTEKDKIVH